MIERKPTHPGEFVREDILKELGLSQGQLAKRLGVSRKTINDLVNMKRGLSPDLAIRIGKFTNTNPKTWMNLQASWDLWETWHSEGAKSIKKIQPFAA
ncbi:MAG: addiction module antidote protein, HigA family [Candidatus Schekmanbacteria bacterium RBG_13_48_7]|uniref:Addiction module antidote protein, HigA family n=1 Tax=Candidatus Schekmanbacteria bacterium RBG_13_48_7 TaxID=1817878 RepID=A0A1F7S1P3_9BACT|nr:MAG: addiction module antidote protein, HigA family [Candidatus Schekmanbacteria bacterium RBG_13_48_7]